MNAQVIQSIAETYPDLPIQVGGGIRDADTIQTYLEAGVQYVIIGTKAVSTPHFVNDMCLEFPGHVLVGLDAKDGKVAIDGWTETTRIEAMELAKEFEDCGVAAINFTDIHRDGMQTGPNLDATRQLAEAVSIPVVASGGVSSIEDIKNLLPLERAGVTGVIIGKALYTGKLDLKEALDLAG